MMTPPFAIFAALSLILAGCQWDHPAATPPAPALKENLANSVSPAQAYADNWCAPDFSVPSETANTLKQIKQAVLQGKKEVPAFANIRVECLWIAEQIQSQASLSLSASGEELDFRPLAVFTSLKSLALKTAVQDTKALKDLRPLNQLEKLDLTGCQLKETDLKDLGEIFPSLKELTLNTCGFSQAEDIDLENLPQLVSLSLAGNQLQGLPPYLPESLISLDLSKNALHSAQEVEMRFLSKLAKLDLSGNSLDSFPLMPASLESLNLSGNPAALNTAAYDSIKKQKSQKKLEKLKSIQVRITEKEKDPFEELKKQTGLPFVLGE
jgi:uncharacterized protein YjbI with pentapeptide repeats